VAHAQMNNPGSPSGFPGNPSGPANGATGPGVDINTQRPLAAGGAACDELSSFEPDREPQRALREFEDTFRRFPTRTVLGSCGPVDGFPASISRPSLFGTPMFTDRAGNAAINNAAMDLPVAQVQ
jgi:hypothetical protein